MGFFEVGLNFSDIESFSEKIRGGFSRWLGRVRPELLLFSLFAVRFLDTLSAWLVSVYRPGIFASRETNSITVRAFTGGGLGDFVVLQIVLYSFLLVISVGLWALAKKRKKSPYLMLALPLAILGFFVIWLYSISMATNIINGFLLLDLPWPASRFVYAVVGYPLAFFVMRLGWEIEGEAFLGGSFLAMVLMAMGL